MIKYDNLIGVPFELGKHDCFSLVIEFYKQNYGITIPNYARPSDWRADDLDLINLIYEQEKFYKVIDWDLKNLQPGDLLCMAIGSANPNHLTVYVGSNKIIHHKEFMFSNEEMLRDFYRKSICYVLRHPEVPFTPVAKPTGTIQEIIDARYRVKAQEEAAQN